MRRLLPLSLLVTAAVLIPTAGSAVPAKVLEWSTPTSIALGNGKFAFTRGGDVYLRRADGSGETRLTTDGVAKTEVVWSADQSRLAWVQGGDIFSMAANGTGRVNLTNTAALERAPSWSPDATKIAYTSNRDGSDDVFVASANGSGAQNVTRLAGGERAAAWVNGGSKLVIAAGQSSNQTQIWTVQTDGTALTHLSRHAASGNVLGWSPDATKAYFFSAGRIYRGDASAAPPVLLADLGQNFIYSLGGAPSQVSADGTALALETTDGIVMVNLVSGGLRDFHPPPVIQDDIYFDSWSPDGREISFRTVDWGKDCMEGKLWISAPDGSNYRQVAAPVDRSMPATVWSPDGGTFYFHRVWSGYCIGDYASELHAVQLGGWSAYPAAGPLRALAISLGALNGQLVIGRARANLRTALSRLEDAISTDGWREDGSPAATSDGAKALSYLNAAILKLGGSQAELRTASASQRVELISLMRSWAAARIDDVAASGGSPGQVRRARGYLSAGDSLRAANPGASYSIFGRYRRAWATVL